MGWTGCARILLFVFNFIFWLSGGGILGLGIYLMVSNDIKNYIETLNIDSAIPYFEYSAYILIAFGGLVFLVGFCGCCGALRKSQCLLGIYMAFLILVMLGEITVGVLVILFKGEIANEMKARLRSNIHMKYEMDEYKYFTNSWNFVQVEMECCGVDGVGDLMQVKNKTGSYPVTCCKLEAKDSQMPKPKDAVKCQEELMDPKLDSMYANRMGCYQKLVDWFSKHTIIIIGVGFGIAGLEIFGLIFAIMLCREARKESETY